MTDEWARVSDGRFANNRSPLEKEVTAESEGRYDLTVPRQQN